MKNLKLNKELIKTILTARVIDCTEEEVKAIMKMFGFQIKEFKLLYDKESPAKINAMTFEIHHKTKYVIAVYADLSKVIEFSNEWVNFGEGASGMVMPLANVGELIMITLNLFVEKLHIRYDGPEYNEDRDREYANVDEVQELLEYAQSIIVPEEKP